MRSGWARCFSTTGSRPFMRWAATGAERRNALSKADARTPRISHPVWSFATLTVDDAGAGPQRGASNGCKKKPDFATLGSFNDRNKQVYQWTAEEVHRAGLMVFGHTEHAPDSIRAGQDVVEHIWGFSQATMSPQGVAGLPERSISALGGTSLRDWTKLDQLIKDAVASGAYINPTFYFELGLPQRVRGSPRARGLIVPIAIPRSWPIFRRALLTRCSRSKGKSEILRPSMKTLFSCPGCLLKKRKNSNRGYKLAGEFLKRFVQAGGKIQAGTDSPSGGHARS